MYDRRKAVVKQEVISGGDVNYYLEVIPEKNGKEEVVVEIEDIIEFFEMNFSSGTVFKSTVRLCKLRKDLGKPGSTKVYEAEKILYYSKRLLAITKRKSLLFKIAKKFSQYSKVFTRPHKEDFQNFNMTVSIVDPKRLKPYTFETKDFIEALGANHFESVVLNGIFNICQMRKKSFILKPGELDCAERVLLFAQCIASHETAAQELREKGA